MRLRGWSKFELGWLVSFSAVALLLSLLWRDTLFGFTVFLSGVICVVLAAKGNIWTYSYGIYNSLAYAWVSYQNGLYGETMLNALYYFPMQIVGWFLWQKNMSGSSVRMRKLSARSAWAVLAISVIGTAGYGYWLSTLPGQNTPFMDALTNTLSIIAMILMAQRYSEQWTLFIVVNAVSVVMWGYRLLAGNPDAATMVLMWGAYLVNSVYGFRLWNLGAAAQPDAAKPTAAQESGGITG